MQIRHDRRLLTRGIQPNLYHPGSYEEGREFGSILQVDTLEPAPEQTENLFETAYDEAKMKWNFRRLLAQKYDVVVTNPPYMGASGMSAKLSEFVKKNYPDSKSDLFACFMERGNDMAKPHGFNCMVTMQSWMFLSSFEKMRTKLLRTKNITNLMHMENMVMGIAFGTAVTVMQNAHINSYKGTYNQIKLQDIENGVPKEFPVSRNRFAQVSTDNFSKIPGSPVAYWVSEKFIATFDKGISIDQISKYTGSQNITANNDKYLRFIWEVHDNKIGQGHKWVFYIKGGLFRKWYGNIELLVDWSDKATTFYRTNATSNLLAEQYRFKEGITYTELTSGINSFRYLPPIAVFDKKGPCIVDVQNNAYCLAFFNSKVAVQYFKLLNPTITLQVKDVKNTPLIIDKTQLSPVSQIVEQNVNYSKADWDSYETSWDFKKNPLV